MTQRAIAWLVVFIAVIGVLFVGSALIEQKETVKDEARLKQLSSENQGMLWTEDNTLVIDGNTFGFDHRIETFLFIGTDDSGNESGEGEQYRGAMADFLLLMVLDHTEDTIAYLQIDRNTITEVNELDLQGEAVNTRDLQICTAYWYGFNPEMSCENTVQAVRQLLGELGSIDGYYAIKMSEIGTLNHAVGGVEITFEEDLTMVDQSFVIGETVILGDEQAEKFIRARMHVGNEENEVRMDRQRQYMTGLFGKIKRWTQSNPQFGAQLWQMLREIAVTDMNGNEFSRIARKMLKGEEKGFFRLKGEAKLGTLLQDGLEHEEYYTNGDAVTEVMTELFSLVPIDDEEEMDAESDNVRKGMNQHE